MESTSLENIYGLNTINNYSNLESILNPEEKNKDENNKIVFFKNDKHTFKAEIKKQFFGYTVKIGGDKYNDCINISISLSDNIVTDAKIAHIQSEPECGFGSILDNGDTVNFIKSSLQFCKYYFPSLKILIFDDMSNIDCGTSKNLKPPRHPEKPFSLAYLSIAKYGKTWYEDKFGAKMIDQSDYSKYREATNILKQPISMDFYDFVKKAQCTDEQSTILKKYYDPAISWNEFFNRIPKNLQCFSLYGWLGPFIHNLLKNTYDVMNWYIDIDLMVSTKFEMIGGMKRKTRRNRKNALKFRNQY
jgi:hypothetical protein